RVVSDSSSRWRGLASKTALGNGSVSDKSSTGYPPRFFDILRRLPETFLQRFPLSLHYRFEEVVGRLVMLSENVSGGFRLYPSTGESVHCKSAISVDELGCVLGFRN